MKLLVLGLALLFIGCTGCATIATKPDCYCDGPVINGACDGIIICHHEPRWCPLDGGTCCR